MTRKNAEQKRAAKGPRALGPLTHADATAQAQDAREDERSNEVAGALEGLTEGVVDAVTTIVGSALDQPQEPKPPKKGKGPMSEHDFAAGVRDGYGKLAKAESRLSDLKGQCKSARERVKQLERELRTLLAGQALFPFGGAVGKPVEVELEDGEPTRFHVVKVGTNEFVDEFTTGDPLVEEYRRRPADFIVRPGAAPADLAGSPASKKGKGSAKGRRTARGKR